jgi:hypothetical protein
MEVSGQRHAPATLFPDKDPRADRRSGGRKVSTRDSNPSRPARSSHRETVGCCIPIAVRWNAQVFIPADRGYASLNTTRSYTEGRPLYRAPSLKQWRIV